MNKSEVDELLGDRYLWSVDGNNGRRYLQMNDCRRSRKSGEDVEAFGGHRLLQKSSGDGKTIERHHVLRNDGDDVSFGYRHLQWCGDYDEMFDPHRLSSSTVMTRSSVIIFFSGAKWFCKQ